MKVVKEADKIRILKLNVFLTVHHELTIY